MYFASKIFVSFLSQSVNAGGITKGKSHRQVETSFQADPMESELSSSSKRTLSEAMEMNTSVCVPGENDRKLNLQFDDTR